MAYRRRPFDMSLLIARLQLLKKECRDAVSANRVGKFYIGNDQSVACWEWMQEKGITHVISVMRKPPPPSATRPIGHLHIPMNDNASAPLFRFLIPAINWMQSQPSTATFLIHCRMGVSRSPSIACGWLMSLSKWSRDYALDFIRKKRAVQPNYGFMEQLQTWEIYLTMKEFTTTFADLPVILTLIEQYAA